MDTILNITFNIKTEKKTLLINKLIATEIIVLYLKVMREK